MGYRCKDFQTGFLFASCKNCKNMTCLATGTPCAEVEKILKCVTHTRRQADAQPWGDMHDLERAAMYKDITGRTAIVEVW